jgi:hypothetical protein
MLAAVASENRKLEGSTGRSLFSQQRTVKRTDTYGLTKEKQEEKYEVRGTVRTEDAGLKRSRTVKSEVIPEDKSVVNVLYVCEVNNSGYNFEYSNKITIKSRTHELSWKPGHVTICKVKLFQYRLWRPLGL